MPHMTHRLASHWPGSPLRFPVPPPLRMRQNPFQAWQRGRRHARLRSRAGYPVLCSGAKPLPAAGVPAVLLIPIRSSHFGSTACYARDTPGQGLAASVTGDSLPHDEADGAPSQRGLTRQRWTICRREDTLSCEQIFCHIAAAEASTHQGHQHQPAVSAPRTLWMAGDTRACRNG
jgi:hypothetical protein